MSANNKFKLAYITHYAPLLSPDADAIFIMQTCTEIVNQGVQLNLYVPKHQINVQASLNTLDSVWEFYGVSDNFHIHLLPSRFLYALRLPGRIIYKLFSLLRAIAGRPQVLYTRQLEVAWLAAQSGRITILAEHNPRTLTGRMLFRSLIRLANQPGKAIGFVTVTQAGAEFLLESGLDGERILVAPSAVRLENYPKDMDTRKLRRSLGLPVDKTIVGFSGNLYPGRGIEELIDAAKAHPSLHFLILGGFRQDIQRCQEFARGRALNNLQFAGFVPHYQVPNYLAASDILVMPYTTNTPTRREMSPMKMFEYMAAGKPIVATDLPVIREILTDKENAVLVEPDNAEALAAGIQWLLDHPAQSIAIGQRARQDAESHTWEKRAARILTWIESTFGEFMDKG